MHNEACGRSPGRRRRDSRRGSADLGKGSVSSDREGWANQGEVGGPIRANERAAKTETERQAGPANRTEQAK